MRSRVKQTRSLDERRAEQAAKLKELASQPAGARVASVHGKPLSLSSARHLHPFFPKLQPRLPVDLARRLLSIIQAIPRLMQVSDKISVDHRVQRGGEKNVPNEGRRPPLAPL